MTLEIGLQVPSHAASASLAVALVDIVIALGAVGVDGKNEGAARRQSIEGEL